jgi:signal transduction histidine kinase
MSVRPRDIFLHRRLIEAQEQERARLARELHDDLGQRIAMLAMDFAHLAETIPNPSSGTQALMAAMEAQVAGLGKVVQAISHRLHSAKLDYIGLPAAAAHFCSELASQHRINVEYVHEGVPADLPRDVALNLFRVLQEALSNAVKHAGAGHYTVTLRGTVDDVRLEVRDDGCGFDVASAMKGSGLGLLSMQERLSLVNGEAVIESHVGRGTRVRARAPLQRSLSLPKAWSLQSA